MADEALRELKSCFSRLYAKTGRPSIAPEKLLVRCCSPTPSACGLDISGTGFLSSYAYDVLNNLTSASQGGINPRAYAYDMLSRLSSEANPESGTTTYSYDTGLAGDLYQRTGPEAKPNRLGHGYDHIFV